MHKLTCLVVKMQSFAGIPLLNIYVVGIKFRRFFWGVYKGANFRKL